MPPELDRRVLRVMETIINRGKTIVVLLVIRETAQKITGNDIKLNLLQL